VAGVHRYLAVFPLSPTLNLNLLDPFGFAQRPLAILVRIAVEAILLPHQPPNSVLPRFLKHDFDILSDSGELTGLKSNYDSDRVITMSSWRIMGNRTLEILLAAFVKLSILSDMDSW
jgi:hypothetical protein